MHFDETRKAYLAEFDRWAAHIRGMLADPKFRWTDWSRDGYPFRDLDKFRTGVDSLNRLQEVTERAASEAAAIPDPALVEVPVIEAAPAVHLFPEDHYRDTWRKARVGIRTDWDLIGDESRESWRKSVDESGPEEERR